MAAITAPAPAPSSAKPDNGKAAPVMVNPFTKASRKKVEQFLDVSSTLGTSAKTLQQVDVPANGYLRHLVLTVTVDGITGATYAADAPWNVIDNVTLTDVNGQPLLLLTGWELYLANLLGGYTQHSDPTQLPGYSKTATGFSFQLRVPVEIIQRNAFGALVNLNAAMTYKLKITLAPADDVFTAETGTANVAITGVVEAWSNPPAADLHGMPNATTPPALGVTQNWTAQVIAITNGNNTSRLARVGNQIRNIILEGRDSTGARSEAMLPDVLGFYFDGNQWIKAPLSYYRQRAAELYGPDVTIPDGVIVLPFTDDFDGTPGEEMGDFYLGTSGASRLEFQAQWKAAGSLTVVTNDILASAATGGAGATLGAQG